MAEINYKKFPRLAAYIERIGAEQRNFRRFMVVEYKAKGYYNELCVIKLEADGAITCTDKKYAPTKEEAEAIKIEIEAAIDKFPKSVLTTDAKLKDLYAIAKYKDQSTHHVFYTRAPTKAGNIVMVQQRVEPKSKEKFFINWSYWSDGKWRAMEPDQKLPFWKPKVKEEERGGQLIMIHEGAKTAKFLTDLKANPNEMAKHPFGDVLKDYEHWGMIGGALVPHRSDWEELIAEKPLEVVYVCDNDQPGREALQKVSENFGRNLLGVMFDSRFRSGFDLADPFPVDQFKDGHYIGPRFEDLLTFATFATKLVPDPDRKGGKGRAVLTEHFAKEWLHCVQPEVFIHRRWPSLILNLNEFNNHVSPFSHVDDTARLLKKHKSSKSAVLAYTPAREAGLYADAEGVFINTHVGTTIKIEKGDVGPFLDFMEHLIPSKADRHELLRWCATLIACRDIKVLYGVLLVSEAQGIGKGTLGERILAPLIGYGNVSYPSESEIVDSNYNYWSAHKRLAVIHEIYAGHSAKAYNKLKSIITDKNITVMKKYQANYIIDNWVHVLACSNSHRAIQLSLDDRRWFVPGVTEEKRTSQYWIDFNNWLGTKGLSYIHGWAFDFVAEHGPIIKGEAAPFTGAKKTMIEDSFSPGMEAVALLLDYLRDKMVSPDFRKTLETNAYGPYIADKDLVDYIRFKLYDGRSHDRIEKPATLRKVAKNRGWVIGDEKVWHWNWGVERRGARLIALDESLLKISPSELKLKPIDLRAVEAL